MPGSDFLRFWGKESIGKIRTINQFNAFVSFSGVTEKKQQEKDVEVTAKEESFKEPALLLCCTIDSPGCVDVQFANWGSVYSSCHSHAITVPWVLPIVPVRSTSGDAAVSAGGGLIKNSMLWQAETYSIPSLSWSNANCYRGGDNGVSSILYAWDNAFGSWVRLGVQREKDRFIGRSVLFAREFATPEKAVGGERH